MNFIPPLSYFFGCTFIFLLINLFYANHSQLEKDVDGVESDLGYYENMAPPFISMILGITSNGYLRNIFVVMKKLELEVILISIIPVIGIVIVFSLILKLFAKEKIEIVEGFAPICYFLPTVVLGFFSIDYGLAFINLIVGSERISGGTELILLLMFIIIFFFTFIKCIFFLLKSSRSILGRNYLVTGIAICLAVGIGFCFFIVSYQVLSGLFGSDTIEFKKT